MRAVGIINIKKSRIKLASCCLQLKRLHRDFFMHQEQNIRGLYELKNLQSCVCGRQKSVNCGAVSVSDNLYIYFLLDVAKCMTSCLEDNLQDARLWQLQSRNQKDL